MDWQIIVLILFALATCSNGKKSREGNADSCNPFIISRLKSDFAFFSMALVVALIFGSYFLIY